MIIKDINIKISTLIALALYYGIATYLPDSYGFMGKC